MSFQGGQLPAASVEIRVLIKEGIFDALDFNTKATANPHTQSPIDFGTPQPIEGGIGRDGSAVLYCCRGAMLRFPSLEDYGAAFAQNWKVFLTGVIGGFGAGFLIVSFWSASSKELLVLELAQAKNASREQLITAQSDGAELRKQIDASADREAGLKAQLSLANAAHDAATAKIAEQQVQIDKLTAAPLRPRMLSYSPPVDNTIKSLKDEITKLTERNTSLERQLQQMASPRLGTPTR